MPNKPKIIQDGNCFYLTQDISGLDLYQKSKAIEQFVKNETKVLENCIDRAIRRVFNENGINILETTESALNRAFDTLKGKGKDIEIVDIYKDRIIYHCINVGFSPNQISVWLEEESVLQCGIEMKVKELKNEIH